MRVASPLVAVYQSNVGRRNHAASLRDETELLPPAPQPDLPKRAWVPPATASSVWPCRTTPIGEAFSRVRRPWT